MDSPYRLKKWFVLIAVFASLLFIASKNLQQDGKDLLETVNIYLANIGTALYPERRIPIFLSDREESLRGIIGEPFISFQQEDWKNFWNILYGVFPLEHPENTRLPTKVRQLTFAEIELRLKEEYPILNDFYQEQWQQFLQIAFGKKLERE